MINYIKTFTQYLPTWKNIIANVLFILLILAIYHLFYDTLHNMDNHLLTLILWLSILSLYGIIYKVTSTCFSYGEFLLSRRKAKKQELVLTENIRAALLTLSSQEISVLNFILKQNFHAAWFPDNYTPVLLLKEKGIIHTIGNGYKTISYQDSSKLDFASLFAIPENILPLISHLKEWKNIEPDYSFEAFQ